MQRDGEIIVVDVPEVLENAFGLAAGIDEDQRGAVRLDELINLAERIARRMAGPRHALGGCRASRHRARRRPAATIRSAQRVAVALRHHETAEIVGLGDRRRKPDAGEVRRQTKQPRQPERQQIAALRGDQRVQFVEDDALERAEQIRPVGGGEQQRQLLRRRQQESPADRGAGAAASRPACRRCASRCGSAVPSRRAAFQIARDIDGQRLQRRNVERMQAALAAHATAERRSASPAPLAARAAAGASLNSTRLGKNPASVLPPPVGAISSTERPAWALAKSSS